MKVKLRVMQGKRAGKEIAIPLGRFLVGRGTDSHLQLKSDSVSRAHCQLSVKDDRVKVKDLGSRNGTHVNGKQVTSCLLNDGDELRVGKMGFIVVVETAVAVVNGEQPVTPSTDEKAPIRSLNPSESDDISAWLEGDELDGGPDTQQFQMDLTKKSDLDDDGEATAELENMGGPAEPGKLPSLPADQSDSSRDAAADMLKKFFNRR